MAPTRLPRVLVAEDNPSLRTLIADVLSLEGCRVTEVGNAADMQAAVMASESAAGTATPFELIVTDIRMPGKSGLEALAELRGRGSRTRFVVITAFPEDATERRIRELDANLLAKPFSLGEFRSLMKTLLHPVDPSEGGAA